jgi:leucyl aminopeptidase
MNLAILHQAPSDVEAPLVAVAVFRGDAPLAGAALELDQALGGAFSRARAAGDFTGRDEEGLVFYAGPTGTDASEGASLRRYLFLGAGDAEKADAGTVRDFAARAVRRAEALRITHLHLVVPGVDDAARRFQAAAEGAVLAAWDFRELRSAPGPDEPPRVTVDEVSLAPDGVAEPPSADQPDDDLLARAVQVGRAFARGENLARTLQQRPGNLATPEHLAATALQLAETHGFEATILGPRELERERMGALLAVAAGSDQEPRLIVLEHRGGPEGDAPLVLVGKGLTFDSGGISMKPPAGMEDMKFDMSGGAAVLGAMAAIGELALALNVVGVVPSSENLVNGRATKPGDVITTRAGKTVEVINTDAEGRLILADALDYAVERFRPRAMVDCATLTGACVVALGHQAAALLGTDEALIEALRDAGDRSGERCWPLPLWEAYRKQLDSPVADLKNVGGRPAGTITAALFLKEFVGEVPWAHLDIAGTAYGEPRSPWHRPGGFGFPTRLLLEWVRGHAA